MSDILNDPRFTPGPDSPAWAAAMGEADRWVERDLEYRAFLQSKKPYAHSRGFLLPLDALNPNLFPHSRGVTRWAIHKACAAIFAGCGLHKTGMQCCWADEIVRKMGGSIMIFAPLVVADQTVNDAKRDYGIDVTLCESMADVRPGINITNYEKLEKFPDPGKFIGVVLDESSILKSYTGSFRKQITEWAAGLQYRLCCTATPSPNDHTELGTHAEFLGVMRREEMLATFFVHDGGKTSDWRLKGHAEDEFWRWVSTWAIAFTKPSDIGYSDEGFELPPLELKTITVDSPTLDGYLFPVDARTLSEQREAKRKSIGGRVAEIAALVNGGDEQWIIFSQLNQESESIAEAIPDCREITGTDKTETKRSTLLDFLAGRLRVVSSKGRIIGFGTNIQCCHNMILGGIDHSHETMFQIIRRCWRFGQKHPVTVYALMSEAERGVWENLQTKEARAQEMMKGMIQHMEAEMKRELQDVQVEPATVIVDHKKADNWDLWLGDSVTLAGHIPDESIHYSIFSPPFQSLFVYTDLEQDMGNCRTPEEFAAHFDFLIPELYRVLKPGRLVSFHCMNLPSSKQNDGFIGLKDFRGDLIRMFERRGFIYHSEVCIWKDPVTAMQRTKALGLLHKQLVKDSVMSRQGIADYLVTMRKPGENAKDERVAGRLEYYIGDQSDEDFTRWCRNKYDTERTGTSGGADSIRTPMDFETFKSVQIWQRYASPVWMDISQSDTLQYMSAREHRDERHICPLQLQVIQRGLQLWTNPRDVVFSPFAGIGSEGHEALRMNRRFVGFELKESYYRQACRNLQNAEQQPQMLFTAEDTVKYE